MKKILSFFAIAIGAMLWVSCQSDLALETLPATATFQVTQDLTTDPGGNTVILKNTTPNSIPHFDYGSGTSTSQTDTIHFPFAGKYAIKFYACVQGGIVQGVTDTVVVTANNLNYVNDPLWTNLTGGVGKSKVWIPDNGNYGFCAGFMSYADPSATQAFENYTINWDPGNSNAGATNTDLSGTMTFDLIGGAHLNVVKPNEPTASTSGTYFLDATNHTLSTTDVSILRIASLISGVTNWTNSVKILELTANQLRIAVLRTDPTQNVWYEVYNFVSKAYADSYVAPAVTYSEPIKTSFTKDDLVGTWKYSLNSENWVGWEVTGSKKGGSLLNNWTTRAAMVSDLTSWGASNAAATFATADNNVYTFNSDGTCTLNGIANSYTVTNGVISFGTPLTGNEWSLIWIALSGSKISVLNVTTIGTTAYKSNGIWIGIQNGTKQEDQAVQLIKQ
ncbi:MAG: hypothetical protein H6Q17_1054 [Bacteroidetes bacterium]|nr:hypothetical protein [Bacteroidota bacterium]